jgi:hypothetical protein
MSGCPRANGWAKAYTNLLGVVFAAIATVMIFAPEQNLDQDGVKFDQFPVAGKAEVRAYYCGTAACISYVCFFTELPVALKAIQVALGGFWGSRVVGYALDGVDSNADRRFHQHAVFGFEVLGCFVATYFLWAACGGAKPDAKRN